MVSVHAKAWRLRLLFVHCTLLTLYDRVIRELEVPRERRADDGRCPHFRWQIGVLVNLGALSRPLDRFCRYAKVLQVLDVSTVKAVGCHYVAAQYYRVITVKHACLGVVR